MAKQVEDIVVRLVGEGFEALDKIKGSFRELGKVTNLAEKDILSARDSLLEYARKAGNTEAVNKGLIDAFKGLRSQTDMCGDAYRSLSADLRQLDEVSRGATRSVMAQRDAVLANTTAGTQNAAALQQQRTALIALRAQTRESSEAFNQFSADIQKVETRINNLADVSSNLNRALSRARAGTAAGARAELTVLEQGIALRRQEIADIDLLNKQQRNSAETQRQRLAIENQLNTALAARRQIQFQETARTGRENVRTGAATFNSADFTGAGYLTAGRISGRIGELPNTTAGLSQELSELNERLINTYRNTETYIAVQLRLAAVQREVTSATQGFGAALLADLNAGTLIPSQKNLAEVIGQLRREMLELDTTTTEGGQAYANNARQADQLERQLRELASAYRQVGSTATTAATAEQNAANARIRNNYLGRGAVRQQEQALRELGNRVQQGVAATPLLLPAAGQTSAPGTGGLISGGARRLRGQVETTFGAGVDAAGNTPRAPWQQNYLPNAAVGTAPAVGFAAGAAQAFDNLGRSTDRARRPLRDIFAELERVRGASNGSVNSLQAQISAWTQIRNAVSSSAPAFATATKQIEALSKQRERLQVGADRRLTGSQLAQGAGAAITGGIFGGPEGLIGGLGGLAVGGVGGAFAGAAFGAQAGMFRQQLGGTADYAASIGKLQIALRGVVGSQQAYDAAIRAAAAATRDLNIPQEEATRGLTRLSAAVIGAGGTVADSSFAFRAMSEAIKATGGNAEQVDGALLALTQVFSKGKVSAEELNQIAERLPGTFTLFAKATGKTGPELQKALEQGQVGLNDLMKFLELTSTRYGKLALDIAGSSQDAGARLTVAFQAMRLEVGKALQPLGAELQGAFAAFIADVTPAVVGSAKALAAALSFLTTNDLVAFGVQLTAVSLGFKGLQVAAAALTSLNVASWFTATAVGARVTSSGMAAATVTTNGLTAALKAMTVAMAKNPVALLVLAGTAAAIKIGSAVLEQKKLNDEVQRSLDIAAKAPASGVAAEINTTQNALREARSKHAEGLQDSDFFGFGLIAAEADVRRLEAKLQKLKTTYKGRVEIETIFKGLGAVPTGYKVINGRLAYLSPGQGYVDAETGEPVADGRSNFPGGGNQDKEARERAGASLLTAIEQREEALLNLRAQREEQLAQIREQAVEQAKQIETQLAGKRLAIERQIQDITQQRADSAEDSQRRIRGYLGEDSRIIEAEQEIADIFRGERDARLDTERRLADDKQEQERTIAEFQRGVAKSINDANRAHTKSMGEIQKQYATSVAKIIDEGTGKAGKRLAAAAELAALYVQRATLNSQIAATTGVVIPARRQGGYNLSDVGLGQGIATPQSLKEDTTFKGTQVPLRVIIDGIDPKIEKLQKDFNLSRTPTRTPGIGDQFTALLGAEGGYEDVASQQPLPIQRMQRQAARPFLELWKTWESFSNDVFGPSKQEIKRATQPDPARNTQVLERIQRTQTAIDNYDPIESKWKEIDNKLREVKRSKPAVMSAASLVNAVESIYTDLSGTVRRAGGLAVQAGERLGSMLDFSDYASPQQSQVIGKGVREVLSRAYDRSVMLGGDKNAFNNAIAELAPLTRKFGALIQDVLQIEARKGYAYAEKALPRLRLAPIPAARPEDRQNTMDRLDRMYEQPYITPGIRNRIEGASLFGAGFDVSKVATDFGQIASASFIGGLLAQNSAAPRPYRVGDTIPGPPATQPAAYRIPVIPSAAGTSKLRDQQAEEEREASRAGAADKLNEAFRRVNAESTEFTKGLNEQLQLLGSQRKYLDMGFSESLSRDLAALDKQRSADLAELKAKADTSISKGNDRESVNAMYDREVESLNAIYAINVRLTEELERQAEALRTRQDTRIGRGIQEGATSYIESIGTMRDATAQLTQVGIKGLEDQIFSLATTGKANFRDFAADIVKQTTRMIIQQMILRVIMRAIGAIGGGGGGGGGDPTAAGGDWISAVARMNATSEYAMGGAFAKNGIVPYAMGGVVGTPTLFKFANGGAMRTGIMGEAGPEAIIPLKRGRDGKLGVSGGSGTAPVTVNVSVDASGSQVQGNSGQGEALGRAIAQAVQAELVKQKRSGGLLAS